MRGQNDDPSASNAWGTSGRPAIAPTAELLVVAIFSLMFFLAYFAPVLLNGRLLAIGDAVIQYLPLLITKSSLWNHYMYAGHPAFADPQSLIFSPLRLMGGNYNAAVVAVYVLAATSAYCLVRHLTGLRLAGVLAAIIYGSGGPMLAHLGHLTIIYSAAFTPLIIWSVAVAREKASPIAMTVGAISIALSIIGGHPQIFVYSILLAGAYALYIVASSPGRRKTLVIRYTVLFTAGLAIASIQLIPLVEAGARSIRLKYSFEEFISYALSPRELLLLIFPRMMGGAGMTYFGVWGTTELTTYCGIATIMLAIAAVSAHARERQLFFWVVIVIIAVAYALGGSTPLAKVVYHVPGLNQFRAPARTAFVTALALAVLAGFGYRALTEHRLRGSHRTLMWSTIILLFGAAISLMYLFYPGLDVLAAGHGIRLSGWLGNPAMYIPLAAIVLSTMCIVLMLRKPSSLAAIALAFVLLVDLASFGWYCEWRAGVSKDMLTLNKHWQEFATEVHASSRRVVFINGAPSYDIPVKPNLNVLYGLPSASSYGPLLMKNYADATGLDVRGAVGSRTMLKERLKLMGAAWVIGGNAVERPFNLGGDCSAAAGRQTATVQFPTPVLATRIEIVSQLGCSTQVVQGTPVVRIDIVDAAGVRSDHDLLAGRDTAEWAIDRPDVASTIKHRRGEVVESFPAGGFEGHRFKATVELGAGEQPIKVSGMTFNWLLPPGAAISFKSIDLVDADAGTRRRLSSDDLIFGDMGLAEERTFSGIPWVRRVDGVGSIAWIVGETVQVTEAQALDVIHQGRLPDGRAFDPYKAALVDTSSGPGQLGTGEVKGDVRMLQWDDGLIRMETNSPRVAFLVVAQSFYPGWSAAIDGVAAPIVQTNLAFQGVSIPEGRHNVTMSFLPPSLLRGILVALVGIGILVAYLVIVRRPRSMSTPTIAPPALRARW